ncbi:MULTISPECIES: hypothetical protein [Mycobacterium avium complex (MAC)]|uniref:hypothetical protein n=1 Tax=Mycobacterium avium complex (MAC) TaxID=120793 RepID=UPI0018D38919|nr:MULTISPECIES: hypothetical protein [Mycobacterium avium complex (MAC)]UCN12796.1 hypothetical protein LFT50_28135 [Mycobacterium intracellulare subsp. chimaera]
MSGELWTTAEAAAAAGVRPDSFRGLMRKARLDGIDLRADRTLWPDHRTPMYDAQRVRRWLDTRPRVVSSAHREEPAAASRPPAEIAALIAVVSHPDRFDTDALRDALDHSGYRVGELSVVATDAHGNGRPARYTV